MPNVTILRTGAKWRLRMRLQGQDHYRFVDGSREAAEAAAAAWQVTVEYSGSPPASPTIRLAAWLQQQLDTATHLQGQSRPTYQRIIDNHLDFLGARRLKDITAQDGQAYKTALVKAGCGAATCHQVFRFVKSGIAAATAAGVLAHDPFAKAAPFKAPRVNRPVIAPAALGHLVRAGSARDDVMALAILLGAETGARRSELVALRWQDVEADTIAITAQLDYTTPGTLRRAPLKTESSLRRVRVSNPHTLAVLEAARQAARRVALAAGRQLADMPVLPDGDGVSWWHPNTFTQAVRAHLRRNGEPGSPSTLRHSNATALISAGVSPREVQRRLGHGDVSTTLRLYTHALPADDTKAASVMADILTPSGGATLLPLPARRKGERAA